jgi:hypothetical protein
MATTAAPVMAPPARNLRRVVVFSVLDFVMSFIPPWMDVYGGIGARRLFNNRRRRHRIPPELAASFSALAALHKPAGLPSSD